MSFFQVINFKSFIFDIVKRKRTQALLGSNLLAILFADTLNKGKVAMPSFGLFRNPVIANKTQS